MDGHWLSKINWLNKEIKLEIVLWKLINSQDNLGQWFHSKHQNKPKNIWIFVRLTDLIHVSIQVLIVHWSWSRSLDHQPTVMEVQHSKSQKLHMFSKNSKKIPMTHSKEQVITFSLIWFTANILIQMID